MAFAVIVLDPRQRSVRTRSTSASAAGPLRAAHARAAGRHLQEERRRRTIKKIPQQSRHLAIASGDIQCAATTVETWLVWNANGVLTKQIFQLDKSYGADGMATRGNIAKIADLKGKTIGSQAPGTSPYFVMAWMLKKNGLTPKDVTVVSIDPGPAAQAFLAGQYDAVMTYEPYLSSIRAKPDAARSSPPRSTTRS